MDSTGLSHSLFGILLVAKRCECTLDFGRFVISRQLKKSSASLVAMEVPLLCMEKEIFNGFDLNSFWKRSDYALEEIGVYGKNILP